MNCQRLSLLLLATLVLTFATYAQTQKALTNADILNMSKTRV